MPHCKVFGLQVEQQARNDNNRPDRTRLGAVELCRHEVNSCKSLGEAI